jgi:hypothetical protein
LCMSNTQKMVKMNTNHTQNVGNQSINNTKITKCDKKNMFIVWKFMFRNTGNRSIDQNPTWLIHQCFFTLDDAIKYQNSIVTSKTK